MNNIVTGLALLVLFFVVNCESLTSFKQDGCKVHKSYKSQSYRLNEKCFIRSQSGRCMANISSYHFSPKQNKCVQSTFGGCNDGCFAFKTMQECESSCLRMSIQPIKEEPQSMKPFGQKKCSVSKPKIMTGFLSKLDNKCFIKTQPGMCRGATPSYHFDTTQNKCVEANFGGCDDGCLAFKSIQEWFMKFYNKTKQRKDILSKFTIDNNKLNQVMYKISALRETGNKNQ
ncbi:hypothetical protein K502DRAFT_351038 [Neoconidiobolus thromboides FSU 785]|nr:hypothetical protein K502DRAFT_351038 [Neoconidiobolus thromboides FSU 785]